MLRFYFAVARTAYRRQLTYRWANLAGLLTNIFFGAIFSYVMIALFHARPVAAGYNVRDVLRYIWLVQAMVMIVLTFGWYDLMLTIRSGEVVSDLSKPCDFYWYWFSREMGRSAYYLLFRGCPRTWQVCCSSVSGPRASGRPGSPMQPACRWPLCLASPIVFSSTSSPSGFLRPAQWPL